MGQNRQLTRRHVIALAYRYGPALTAASLARIEPAAPTPAEMQDAIRGVIGAVPLRQGKVKLDVPPLVENGNTVPMTVSVTSPMTAEDHVTAIHVFNEKNPQPHFIHVKLGPRSGRASVSIRIRLADSQKIVAIAEMSDGSFWSTSVDVVVTLAACVEPS